MGGIRLWVHSSFYHRSNLLNPFRCNIHQKRLDPFRDWRRSAQPTADVPTRNVQLLRQLRLPPLAKDCLANVREAIRFHVRYVGLCAVVCNT